MSKKISIGVCISLIIVACAVTFVVTWTVSFNMYNDLLPGVPERDAISSKLQEIDSFVRNNFLYDVNDDDISHGIFSGYVAGLGDAHTAYLPASMHRQRLAEEGGQLVTVGVRAEPEGSGYLQVSEVYIGSPAESAGILVGDVIIEVDGINVLEAGASVALELLDGEEYTPVSLTTQREGQTFIHPLIRQSVDLISVETDVVDEIGFMRITSFNALTANQFESGVQTFVQSGVRAMLFDLRDNDSSVFAPVNSMVNLLVGGGTIARSEHRGEVTRDFIVTDDSVILPSAMQNIPIVVLTNSRTSGAGELFATILRMYSGAQIVGSGTAGNAYLQQTQELRDGSAIRVTVARISLVNGFTFAGTGITPCFAVEKETPVSYVIAELRDRELSEIADVQIRRAFEIINTN
ncbi:MAG: S41 family peptidase [Oscillospiraceae bacterium]|nr:S41 family peptidase [Oscillospiraceae bacterium]